ncbi:MULTISPECIES: LuxR C-terminal-related transcriptional regulator [unclassified Lysobacter]|uniref:LuxR C-terminal-related transcriptional regulator n=1 Tax=unclassified Lysobacter TaxID=2635362 RepID=UPI001BE4F9C3|nr:MULTISPECIES: LuxR C-terminal-related transcriptional regulator [unclassified Lysobacter]MBT2748310.1 response regulator transcription factor [Lysobacter sp. ISL-42]MBT2749923.1 response regulator transcription factor [Lysobacter sp. ISL-50]MBT2781251.1 response regulator transcription factor [Lysobacter sp. ISL-52]
MKYIVADDETSMRLLVSELIKSQFGSPPEDVWQCATGDQLLEIALHPEYASAIIVTELLLPGRYRRLDLVKELRRSAPFARVIVHTRYKSPHLAQELIFHAVHGYVFKTSPTIWLKWAIANAIRGDRFIDETLDTTNNLSSDWWDLTVRESDVVIALCRGWPMAKICSRFEMKKKTVSAHKCSAREKLSVTEDAGLTAYLYANGLDYLMDE